MPFTPIPGTTPLSPDTQLIRAELDSPKPAVALGVALVAFHGLTGKEVRELQPTDIVDGRLTFGNRQIHSPLRSERASPHGWTTAPGSRRAASTRTYSSIRATDHGSSAPASATRSA